MSAPVTLRRVLKFRTIVSTSTGLAYAAVSLLGCLQLAYYLGGDSGWVAILIAGLLALLAAFCFSELNALYPTAAAIRLYMKEAFSDNFSLIITFGYLLTIVTAIAADSYVVGRAITYAFGLPDWASLIWILASLITGSSGLMTGTPLIITLVIFIISALYVYLAVPRIRAAAAARRAAVARRRPPKREITTEEQV